MNDECSVKLDFYRDWIAFLREMLTNFGQPPSLEMSDEQIEFRYFNIVKRTIRARPRQVHCPLGFSVPESREVGFAKFVEDARTGISLNPYLSRRLKDADYDDPFLNDWGVYHFHVGTVIEDDGFVERGDPLLFARVSMDHIWVCGFFGHGAWEDYDAMEVLHANWPEALEQYKAPQMIPLPERLGATELRQLRRAGATVPLQMLDGTIYIAPGGGITTAKLGAAVVSEADRHYEWIRRIEAHVRDELVAMKPQIEARLNRECNQFEFKLGFNDGEALAIEHNHGFALNLGPVPTL